MQDSIRILSTPEKPCKHNNRNSVSGPFSVDCEAPDLVQRRSGGGDVYRIMILFQHSASTRRDARYEGYPHKRRCGTSSPPPVVSPDSMKNIRSFLWTAAPLAHTWERSMLERKIVGFGADGC